MKHILFSFEQLFRHLRFASTGQYKVRYAFLGFVYDLIRPLFIKDWDFNEDFICGTCGKPVLKRYLFCGEKCSEKAGW